MGGNSIMRIDEERKRLSQDHNLEQIARDLKATDMVTVYRWTGSPKDYFIFCMLIQPDHVEQMLSDTRIDNIESLNGMPDAITNYTSDGEQQAKYLRFDTEDGFEQLIFNRTFGGIKKEYIEISEEFRHIHDLYHDRKTDKYIKIDDAGNEETIVIVSENEVQIRHKEIRQFLAVKEMSLSMLFEFNEYSEYSLEELGLNENKREFKRRDLMFWRHDYSGHTPYEEFRSDSRLRGWRLIKPLPKSKCGFGDFSKKTNRYVDFIIDVDENGDEIYHTCDPQKLERFGENPNAAWELTPVFFRKKVLDKYYNESDKYSVEDSMVSCASLWSIKIDNHLPDKVCVFLRDLGIYLPYTEQLHWLSDNIIPEGTLSETFIRRNFGGEWVSSNDPEHLIKQNYHELQKVCDEHLGWQLLKPLRPGDEHRLKRLRISTVDEEAHFKDSVLDLANILIDRLNEKHLEDLIPVNKRKDNIRGINRLEYVLNSQKVIYAEKHIIFLRCLWDLRVTRSGSHTEILEDSRYIRASAHFELDNLNKPDAFTKILVQAVEFLVFLIAVVESGKFSNQNDKDC